MQNFLKKLLHILDGTPAEYGIQSRGQSVLELALITPILIVLLMGLAEIGWFANNYMILLEATRTGARFGTVQTGQNSPLAWNNRYSLVPDELKPGFFNPPDAGTENERIGVRNCDEVSRVQAYQGFYSLLNCVVLQSLNPLSFKLPDNAKSITYPDEIIISTFALQLVDPRDRFWNWSNIANPSKSNKEFLVPVAGVSDNNLPRVVVVGRYPTNANECTVGLDGTGRAWDGRDPFDYIQNGVRDYFLRDPNLLPDPNIEDNRIYMELIGADPFNASDSGTFERQRGFAFAGQHNTAGDTGINANCIGSEWTISEVEQLINLPGFSLTAAAERSRLASMGMVLVEMFWQHELLLKNPVFNPVFTAIGAENTTLYVWAAFPVPAVEPRIRFPK